MENVNEQQQFNKFYEEQLDQFKDNKIEYSGQEEIKINEIEDAESREPSSVTLEQNTLQPETSMISAVVNLSETVVGASVLTASALLSATTTALLSSSQSTATTNIPVATPTHIGNQVNHGIGGPGASVRLNESTSLSMASTVIIWLLKLVFGHVPYFIFRILSTTLSFTVTLDFWTGLYLFCFSMMAGVLVYRCVPTFY